MTASLGPTWNLRCSSPRCITAYVTRKGVESSQPDVYRDSNLGIVSNNNPFDDEVRPAWSAEATPVDSASTLSISSKYAQSRTSYDYSLAMGTEHGSLHYRVYPAGMAINDEFEADSASTRHAYKRTHGSSTGFIDPEASINLQGAVKGAVVGIIRARPSSLANDHDLLPMEEINLEMPCPIFLLLVDDNRGSSSAQSLSPGAYAAHLVVMKHRTFAKLSASPPLVLEENSTVHSQWYGDPTNIQTPSSHRRGGSKSTGSGTMTGWFGGGGGDSGTSKILSGSTSGNTPANTAGTVSLGTLPRMSCATYHPNTGYVYAAGNGVYGLSSVAARAVLFGMTSNMMQATVGGRGISGSLGNKQAPFHHSSNASSSSSTQQAIRQRQGGSIPYTQSLLQPLPFVRYLNCNNALPQPGVRCSSGGGLKNSMTLACAGRVAVVAVTNSFYAVPACLDISVIKNHAPGRRFHGIDVVGVITSPLPTIAATKLLSFAQSSQVHPVIAIELMTSTDHSSTVNDSALNVNADITKWLRPIISLVVLASGRECTAIEIVSTPDSRAIYVSGNSSIGGEGVMTTTITSSAPRHGISTLSSPILAAAPLPPQSRSSHVGEDSTAFNGRSRDYSNNLSAGPLVALLTVDGLVHIRSPFCVAVPMTSIEVGTRPNDFFSLLTLPSPRYFTKVRKILATSYGGDARIVSYTMETPQDFADRLIKLSIDAFGVNGYPRLELAEALGATFSATSYVGSEATVMKRNLLRQYLESVLGLTDDVQFFMSGDNGNVSFVISEDGQEVGLEVSDIHLDKDEKLAWSSGLEPNTLLTCTALLCLVCFQILPPNATLANRASKVCASAMGIVTPNDSSISKAAVSVCDLIASRLLKEVSASFSLLSSTASISSTSRPSQSMEFVESAIWLLRSCGCHEKAIQALEERMNNPTLRNATVGSVSGVSSCTAGQDWSQIKFDSYIATHLGELWSSRDDQCCQLVIRSSTTRDLLSRNPTLGLSIFTMLHPQNEKEWRSMKSTHDPLYHSLYPPAVVQMLKSIVLKGGEHELPTEDNSPVESSGSYSLTHKSSNVMCEALPLHSGRALAIQYLESAIGISSGRNFQNNESLDPDFTDEIKERMADMHDELSFLLLEGIIFERGDGDDGEDTDLGAIYRHKLRRLLSWENARIRSERLLASLPSSFLQEHALLLGRLGRHEDALKIFYSDLNSLDLALEYCDARNKRKTVEARARGNYGAADPTQECCYLPLVRVALKSDPDSDRGTAAAIQVLALRRDSIDKSAALRLLPRYVPMSAVVRPFLIPSVVENESQVRRLAVTASLLRCKYLRLKRKLIEAQLKSQASLHSVPALQKLHLGDPIHSSKAIKASPVHAASPTFPSVMLVKHFFPRHLVIQAQVTNSSSNREGRTLSDITYVIAESSDETLSPMLEIPLKTLPPNSTGSTWSVMAATPQRLETAFLTCELRYTVLAVDATTGAPLDFSEEANTSGLGRTYVEELQDVEIRHSDFGYVLST